MKPFNKVLDRVLVFLPYLIVFIYSLYLPSDPDLGWHLKYGEYFWQHGTVLRDNTFSTMMPNFHWANTSWLTDIIDYGIYYIGGFLGLAIASALLVTVTFYFFAKAFRLKLWQQTFIFPFVLYLENPVNSVSFRGQQIALLFVGILYYLISLYEKRPKLLWLAIPLFWIWSAIDGEFILGLALFGLWIALYIFKSVWIAVDGSKNRKTKERSHTKFYFYLKQLVLALKNEKKEIFSLCLILLGSFLTTFINPFGYGIYSDTLSHIGNPLLKDIAEYLPFNYLSQSWWNEMIVGIILVFGLFVLFFHGSFLSYLPILGGGLLLYVLSLDIRRYAWPAYYLVFPLLAMTANFLKPDGKKETKIAATILLFIMLVGVIWLRYPYSKFIAYNWDTYCQFQPSPCSTKSAVFLEQRNLTHRLFSLYGWGGWLIWNYPQIKPSIDGRMHTWTENSYSAFNDYYSYEQNMKNIDESSYDVVYMTPDKPVYNQLDYLVKIGKWKQVYKDRYAGIFVRNK